ncbi:radical SAM protein [Candidatus Peregrinibacteria bacterium]|jgi:MoaA/NifB/PqqE/SkfB family radical SAM enzyme|nr:radical SAM protein [Candidatus Peregrinibacteria bacterium]MBT7484642.1 radical SAM protein [Candidatus Peregrinibacteria bacterium]
MSSCDIPSEYLNLDDSVDLKGNEYTGSNLAMSLPAYSVALKPVFDEFEGEEACRLIAQMAQEAPILMLQTFFINNLVYFFKNFESTKQLSAKVQRLVHRLEGSPTHNLIRIGDNLAKLAQHRRVTFEGGTLECLHKFTDVLLRLACIPEIEITGDDMGRFSELAFQCRSVTEFDKLIELAQERETLDLAELKESSGIKPYKFDHIGLRILDGCTIQCSFCCEQATACQEDWKLLSVDDLRRMEPVLKEAHSLGITGGECFDHPNLIEICEYLRSINVPFTLDTTGGELEDLEQLLPMMKEGSLSHLDVSVHDFYGARGKRRSSQTTAFLVKNNIPFSITLLTPRIRDAQEFAEPLIADLDHKLGLKHYHSGQCPLTGKNGNFLNPNGINYRNSLVQLLCAPLYATGQFEDNPDAIENTRLAIRQFLEREGSTRSFCKRTCHLSVRPDGTVAPCHNVMEGGNGGIPRLLDHLPTSLEELVEARVKFEQQMETIYEQADREGVLPCEIHRRLADQF